MQKGYTEEKVEEIFISLTRDMYISLQWCRSSDNTFKGLVDQLAMTEFDTKLTQGLEAAAAITHQAAVGGGK